MMTRMKGPTMPHRSPFPHVLLEPKVPHDGWTPCHVAPGILLFDSAQTQGEAEVVGALLEHYLTAVDPAGGDDVVVRRWRQQGAHN